MGETDIETMANVTIAKYDFEDESFGSVSRDCIDFISKLLVKDLKLVLDTSYIVLSVHTYAYLNKFRLYVSGLRRIKEKSLY